MEGGSVHARCRILERAVTNFSSPTLTMRHSIYISEWNEIVLRLSNTSKCPVKNAAERDTRLELFLNCKWRKWHPKEKNFPIICIEGAHLSSYSVKWNSGLETLGIIHLIIIIRLILGNEPLVDERCQIVSREHSQKYLGCIFVVSQKLSDLFKYMGGSAASRSKALFPERTFCEDWSEMLELDGRFVNNYYTRAG